MRRLLEHIRHAWDVRRARRQLETLSNEQLRDIGLTRDQVASFARSIPGPEPLRRPQLPKGHIVATRPIRWSAG